MAIIKFPVAPKTPPQAEKAEYVDPPPAATANKIMMGLLGVVWLITTLAWPLLKWVIAIDVTFQFLRMLYHWDTPGVYAGFTFLLHFFAFAGLQYFVAFFTPTWLAMRN